MQQSCVYSSILDTAERGLGDKAGQNGGYHKKKVVATDGLNLNNNLRMLIPQNRSLKKCHIYAGIKKGNLPRVTTQLNLI